MKIKEIIPKVPTRLYCAKCDTSLVLVFRTFKRVVSDIQFNITALPMLACPDCKSTVLPDRSRAVICKLHFDADGRGRSALDIPRQKIAMRFAFCPDVAFDYDADDYFYLPGLVRSNEDGFLTPVFFEKVVLLKFAHWPGYSLRMYSKSYGSILKGDEYSIPFGVNRNGKVLMWLGDLDKLPLEEQRYLHSENVASDHDIGSEFYDGQIEAIFTPRKPEDEFYHAWLKLMTAVEGHLGTAIDTLRVESLAAIDQLVPPLTGQDSEILQKCDAFNKVTLEALEKSALVKVAKANGVDTKDLGSLKLLVRLLANMTAKDADKLLGPLFVMYDLRVLESHRHGKEAYAGKIVSAASRLGLPANSSLLNIYGALIASATSGINELTAAVLALSPTP